MKSVLFLVIGLMLAAPLSGVAAHALLDSASPAVGATVDAAPTEIRIAFSEGLEPAFSGIVLIGPDGHPVAVGKATLADPQTLVVRIAGALRPGTYVVKWHVVSADTHRTSGAYKFTIAK